MRAIALRFGAEKSLLMAESITNLGLERPPFESWPVKEQRLALIVKKWGGYFSRYWIRPHDSLNALFDVSNLTGVVYLEAGAKQPALRHHRYVYCGARFLYHFIPAELGPYPEFRDGPAVRLVNAKQAMLETIIKLGCVSGSYFALSNESSRCSTCNRLLSTALTVCYRCLARQREREQKSLMLNFEA